MAIEVKVPEVGESITEVYIGEWRKREGDAVAADEDLVEIESEKATFDVPAAAAGTLTKILKEPGATAQVGEVIAYIEPGEEKKPSAKPSKKEKAAAAESQGRPSQKGEESEESEPEPSLDTHSKKAGQRQGAAEGERTVMPAAKRLLAERKIAAEEVAGTGPGGRLLKEDVLRHIEEREDAEEAPADRPEPKEAAHSEAKERDNRPAHRQEEALAMSPIRRQIAKRLVAAQQTAALLTTFNEVDLSAVKALREESREAFQQKHGVKLGYMSFFVKAAVDALLQLPQVNAEVRGTQIVYHNYCDIGIAIGSGRGLVVPVLRNAEQMSFAEIEQAIHDFSRRAEQNELKLDELRGGTFTISNGGVYGSLLSTPIVNPPQSGVLGMHAIQDRPVVVEGEIVVRPMMYLALTYDHRVVDGREAVTFLKRIKEVIEAPARMLIEA